jgi:hypothetical protein
MPNKMFSFGAERWPGLAKLNEECGEVIQIIGKLMMTDGHVAHWSGDLGIALIDEMADVEAAIRFLRKRLGGAARSYMTERADAKLAKFEHWHAHPEEDVPPPLGGFDAK